MTYTRRDIAKTALSIATASLLNAAKSSGVTLGVMTYSYRSLPQVPGTERVVGEIEALRLNEAHDIEFFESELQPPQKPEDLDRWRKATSLDRIAAMKKKLDAARVINHAYCVNYKSILTDDDIEATFAQAAALGVKVISTSTQVTMAKRLVPFAEKHKLLVAFHGHSNTKDANEFATPESFGEALALSKYFRINLDIGHFSAAGYDPVDYIAKNHAHITHLHIKDRKKNDGANVPWGEGDTPIKQVLQLLKTKGYPLPALIEYEYRGTGTPVEEVQKCLAYMRNAIA